MSELEELLLDLLRVSFPKGELKARMFEMHNLLVGQSQFITKAENPNTYCGSCVMRVRGNLFKFYHFEVEDKEGTLIFLNRFAINQAPVYGVKKK